MTPNELVSECVRSVNVGSGSVMLVSKGKRTPLPRKGWPRPRLHCCNPRGESVWSYNATNLLAALIAHGLCTPTLSPCESIGAEV